MIGTTVSHYRITAKLGEGGMGEVYRAHDERLDRDVAIKVLPEEVAQDEARLARFEREAKLLASLSHQNIATLYGLEEHEGQRFLVMELAEGETLAERIKKGPIPVDDALPTALQIAEGLEAAHEQGIIHRDLKPANVMLSPEGKVKILDFGLAKAWAPDEGDADLTHSPTLTAQMTAAGVLLGTAAYMSPEQARGKPVDKRADIWAFGCVLWEMLTGQRLFTGDTVSDVLAAVLREEPDLAALPAEVPPRIRWLVPRCLDKAPRNRIQHIGDARIVLGDVERASELADLPAGTQPSLARRPRWRWLPITFVAGGVVTALVLSALLMTREPAPRPVRRYSINLPADAPLQPSDEVETGRVLALSPDGELLVYVARREFGHQLVKRRLDSLEAQPIAGTEHSGRVLGAPFFSPDGRWLGFAAFPFLKRINLAGELPEDLCQARYAVSANWQDNGTILFASAEPAGIYRVPEQGGTPAPITVPDFDAGEAMRLFPEPLPGGKGMLLTILRAMGIAGRSVAVLDLKNDELRILTDRAPWGRYAPTGHVLYPHRGRLMALPFDVDTLTAAGDPVEVTEPGMGVGGRDPLEWAFSNAGTLVYAPVETDLFKERRLVLVDREGGESPVGVPPPAHLSLARLSPDGRRLASEVVDDQSVQRDVWVYDLETGARRRVTFDPAQDGSAIWTLDGERLVFSSARTGPLNLYWIDAHGGGEAERLTESEYDQYPLSFAPDGKVLFYCEYGRPDSGADLWTLSFEGDSPVARPLLETPYEEYYPSISPDGGWLAYRSDETGTFQIVVQPYPAMDREWPVSIAGGDLPVWHPQGDSLFFFDLEGRLMEARVRTEPTFSVDRPRVVLDVTWGRHPNIQLDVMPDGDRFLLLKPPPQEDITELIVVENWFEVLTQKAPPGRKP
jgi:serine/threonine-protein kinase